MFETALSAGNFAHVSAAKAGAVPGVPEHVTRTSNVPAASLPVISTATELSVPGGVAVLGAINDSAHGRGVLANFQTQRGFLVAAALLAGACALAMGAVSSVAAAPAGRSDAAVSATLGAPAAHAAPSK